jgi:hypothetical protein
MLERVLGMVNRLVWLNGMGSLVPLSTGIIRPLESCYIVYKLYIILEQMTLACNIMLQGEGGRQFVCNACYTVLYSATYCITHVIQYGQGSHKVIRIMYLSSGGLTAWTPSHVLNNTNYAI